MRSTIGRVLGLVCLLTAASAAGARQDSDTPPDPSPGLDAGLLSTLSFRALGPALMSGRISDLVVDPQQRSIWYVSAASGGVWKTTNAGVTFEPIFDGYGSYSIGCLALDPADRFRLWVGTGENNSQRSVGYGDGVYLSIDGGKSFVRKGLEQSEHISKIVVHPHDSQRVFVAVQGPLWKSGGERGLYRTDDGGQTWTRILHVGEETGINDLVMDPENPDILYATAYQRRRHQWVLIDGGPESGVYKSTDGGQTWRTINRGLPGGDKGRIGLAVSPINPEIVYALVEAAGDQGGFYRSADRGETWARQGSYVTSSPQYYQEIVACPHRLDRIYALDTMLMLSEDGGKTFTSLGERDKHVDNHALVIDPQDADHLLVGCDGGLYESWDRGATYDFKANLPITQFYKVAVSREEPFYYVYGGTQDNATQGGPSQTANVHGIRNSDWFITVFGDGFDPAVDPSDPNTIYSQWQYGGLVRFDRRTGEEIDIKPQEEKGGPPLRWNWDAALLISPHHPHRIYFGAQILFRSDDRGESWRAVSPDLTRQIDRNKLKVMGRVWPLDAVAKNDSTSFYGTIVALDESPLVEGLLYVGTDDGRVQISEDGGQNWRAVDRFGTLDIPEFSYVSDLKASLHDANTVYGSVTNFKRGDFRPYIVVSRDRGRTWSAMHGDLPERGSVHTLEQDHVRPNVLFCGTEFGCFTTFDEGQKWIPLKSGLPTIAVRDIEIQRDRDDLVLASFGRGIFVLDDYSPLRELSREMLERPAQLMPIKSGRIFVRSNPLGVSGRGFQGANFFTAPNPPYGVTFTLFLKDAPKTRQQIRKERESRQAKSGQDAPYPSWDELQAEEDEAPPRVVLTIRDAGGQIVQQLEGGNRSGLQRVVWDMRHPVSAGPGRGGFGPAAVPGRYTVTVTRTAEGQTSELVPATEFSIEPVAWSGMAQPDRAAILAFCQQAGRLQNAISAAQQILTEAEERLVTIGQTLRQAPQSDPALHEEARQLGLRLKRVKDRFTGQSLPGRHNEPSYPGINSRIQTALGAAFSASTGPTATHRRLYEIAAQEFEEVLGEVRPLIDQDLPALDAKLDASRLPWTPGRKIPDWR